MGPGWPQLHPMLLMQAACLRAKPTWACLGAFPHSSLTLVEVFKEVRHVCRMGLAGLRMEQVDSVVALLSISLGREAFREHDFQEVVHPAVLGDQEVEAIQAPLE